MFLPALEEALKREKENNKQIENLLDLPDLREQYEEYCRKKQDKNQTETVITIQII